MTTKKNPEEVDHLARAVIVRVLNELRADAEVEGAAVVPANLLDTARFAEDLGADSLEHIELIMAFEEEFGIEIGDEDAESLKTVGEAIAYLQKAVAEKGGQR